MANRMKLKEYVDDVIEMYQNGMSCCAIARHYSTTTTTVTSLLIKYGVMPYVSKADRSKGREAKMAKIAELYQQGFSPKEIQAQGFHSQLFYEAIRKYGLELRGQPKGPGVHPVENTLKMMETRERRGVLVMPSEAVVGDFLRDGGIENFVFQKAIDCYGADLAIINPRIAVECVCRGTFAMYFKGGKATEKIKKFGSLGWHVYMLVAQDLANIKCGGVADLIAWAKFLKSSPTERRQYRVFRCGTELLACGCCDDNHLADVWAFCDR